MEQAFGFAIDVINEVQRAIDESGLSNTEIIRRCGMSSDYFYVRMRGEKPFNMNDIDRIANATDMDAFLIMRKAAISADRGVTFDVSQLSDEERTAIAVREFSNQKDYERVASHDSDKRAEIEGGDGR